MADPFVSALPTIDLSTSGMTPLVQRILWLICLAVGLEFEFAGAARRQKGADFDLPFRPVRQALNSIRPPFSNFKGNSKDQSTRSPKTCTNGQWNFFPRPAMLLLVNFQMAGDNNAVRRTRGKD